MSVLPDDPFTHLFIFTALASTMESSVLQWSVDDVREYLCTQGFEAGLENGSEKNLGF